MNITILGRLRKKPCFSFSACPVIYLCNCSWLFCKCGWNDDPPLLSPTLPKDNYPKLHELSKCPWFSTPSFKTQLYAVCLARSPNSFGTIIRGFMTVLENYRPVPISFIPFVIEKSCQLKKCSSTWIYLHLKEHSPYLFLSNRPTCATTSEKPISSEVSLARCICKLRVKFPTCENG